MPFAVHPVEAVPHLFHTAGGDADLEKERLEVCRRPFAVGTVGAFHGQRRSPSAGRQLLACERQSERPPDLLGHAGVIEEQQRVPRVKEDGLQRNRSNAPRPSIESRASGA